MSIIQNILLVRGTFSTWFVAAILLGFASAMRRRKLLPFVPESVFRSSILLRTREGISLRVPLLDVWPVLEVFALREYDFPLIDWQNIRSIIDCGANVGSFSLWVTRRSPGAVLAVEPNPGTLRLLDKNTRHLRDRITCLSSAVSGRGGERVLYDSGYSATASLTIKNTPIRTYSVPTVTLDELVVRSGFPEVDLLKMDVEGAEQEIFEFVPTDTLRKIRAVIVESHSGSDIELIVGKLKTSGMLVECERHVGTALIVGYRP